MLNDVVNFFELMILLIILMFFFGGDVLEVGFDDDADIDIVLDVDNNNILNY